MSVKDKVKYYNKLRKLDIEMIEYRKKCNIPGTPEYEEKKLGMEALQELRGLI